MSKTLKKKKHWSAKVQECAVSWGGSGDLVTAVELRGGAEQGEFPFLGHIVAEAMVCHAGRLPGNGDVLLEVNGTPVSGLTHRDTLAVIRHFREPIRLKTVKADSSMGNCDLYWRLTGHAPTIADNIHGQPMASTMLCAVIVKLQFITDSPWSHWLASICPKN